jgi:hypothetical protein
VHWRGGVQLTEAAPEGEELRIAQSLAANEDDEIIEERATYGFERIRVECSHITAFDYGAERRIGARD